jgi:pantoate--beta-alanine ligase
MGKSMVEKGKTDAATLITRMTANIEIEPLAKIEYIKVVDGMTIEQVTTIKPQTLVAVAVHIGETRLLDNFTTK